MLRFKRNQNRGNSGMKQFLQISSVPCDEDCAQVGSSGYAQLSQMECVAYREQLLRTLRLTRVQLRIKSFPHDFGSYKEVCVFYDDSDLQAEEQAVEAENGCDHWDFIAKKKLTELGYFEMLEKNRR
jgi:hypothetical protein